MKGWYQGWGGHYVWLGPGPRPAHAPDEEPPTVPVDNLTPFVPVFIEGVRLMSTQTGMPAEGWPINGPVFVTDATAETIRQKVGGTLVLLLPFEGTGGPFYCTELERVILFRGGQMVNAAIFADCWRRNPNNENVALQEVRDLLAQIVPSVGA